MVLESFNSSAFAKIKKGEARALKAGGAWIFDNEIDLVSGDYNQGDIIRVIDFDDFFLGYGFINDSSKIRIRMLSRYRKDVPDTAFVAERVKTAWEYRKSVLTKEDLSSCRVIFGEADFLPGLVVDKYENVLVVEALALGIDRIKRVIIEALIDLMRADGFSIDSVFERSDAPVRKKEGMEKYKGLIYHKGQWMPDDTSDFTPFVLITENGVKYRVDVENGQKTGFFLDQKYNRLAMQRICKDADRVLDCFTHMGTFALNAGRAGAKEVTGLDISEFAVEQATENSKLNGLSDRVRFRAANVLDELPRLLEAGEQYDVVILDPPAFTKSREATKNAIKGYREINIKGMKLIKDGGYLATCSCSHFMTQDLFIRTIHEAARSAHKRLRQVEFRTQAPDHPILWSADESYYLKFLIFQVVDEK